MTTSFFQPRNLSLTPAYAFHHPLNPEVTLVGKTVYVQDKPTKGITTGLLARSFYPHYRHELCTLDGPDQEKKEEEDDGEMKLSKKKKNIFKRKPRTSEQLKRAGLNRGRKLDRDMEVVIRLLRKFRLPQREMGLPEDRLHLNKARVNLAECEEVIRRYLPESWVALYGDDKIKAMAKSYRTLLNARSKHSQRLISHWCREELRLVKTQLPVGMAGLPYSTTVDVVLLTNKERIIIANNKTTQSPEFLLKHTPYPLSIPYHDHNDCTPNRDAIQLSMETEFYCETYPTMEPLMDVPRIFRVTPEKVITELLPSWASGRVVSALTCLKI